MAQDSERQTQRLVYSGDARGWLEVIFFDWLYSFITLGLYHFWGKTKIRKYMYSSSALSGDRFEYFGTGKELFLGFLKVFVLFVILIIGLAYFGGGDDNEEVITIGIVAFFGILYPLAVIAAFKYQASRVMWRGIRFVSDISISKYTMISVLIFLGNVITIGLFIPFGDLKRAKMRYESLFFGDRRFTLDVSKASDLMGIHFVTWLIAVPTLGISRFWYYAALNRHIFSNLKFGDISFNSKQTGESLCGLSLGNIFIYLFTFGLGKPWVMNRNMNYIANNLEIEGDINSMAVMQSRVALSKTGEGLASNLGIDGVDIGFGL